MKKILLIFSLLSLVLSCQKVPHYKGGTLTLASTSQKAGQMSFLQEGEGPWTVEVAPGCTWLTTDVDYGCGKSAFTVYYTSNESSLGDVRSDRTGDIYITREDYAVDTLRITQTGINIGRYERGTRNICYFDLLSRGFADARGLFTKDYSLIVLKSASLCEDVEGWNKVTVDDVAIYSKEGIAGSARLDGGVLAETCCGTIVVPFEGCDFETLLEGSYNNPSYASQEDWVILGSFAHFSSRDLAQGIAPSFYPQDVTSAAYQGDILAWNNNLYDAASFCTDVFVPNFSYSGMSLQARRDFIYLSHSLWQRLVTAGTLAGYSFLDNVSSHLPIECSLL